MEKKSVSRTINDVSLAELTCNSNAGGPLEMATINAVT